MNRRTFMKTLPAITVMAGATPAAAQEPPPPPGQELPPILLPKPQAEGGKSVLASLWERRTTREIRDEKLPLQTLSNLLWAAFGVNRETGPRGGVGRTAASASNSQEIDLYVALSEGLYLYEAVPHRLTPAAAGDHRAKTGGRGRRGGAARAPATLVFVADIARYARAPFQEPGLKDPVIQASYYNVATGLIAGNVYLFAASQGLAAWFHNCDKTALAGELRLRPGQRVLFAQTVGYPA